MELPAGVKMTPMLKQYTEWKDKYPGCLLLFRMGDFFELFFDDAVTASEVLDITLTARDHDKTIPMAGVPHHALDSYMSRLIAAGYRVAVCDQMTAPDGHTLVERSVVRVVTPGTYVPQDSEGDGRLAALFFSQEKASIALLTAGTGLLEAGTFRPQEAVSLLFSFLPSELLIAKGQEDEFSSQASEAMALGSLRPVIVQRERGEFSPKFASDWLCKHWGLSSLKAMGIDDDDPASGAAASALRYLEETQLGGIGHVHGIKPLLPSGMLILDNSTQSNLELLDGGGASLYSVLNRCRTPMGRRLLREWITHPLTDLEDIVFRQDCVEDFVNSPHLIKKISDLLSECRDMERALGRLSMKVGNPRDLGAVRDTLSALPPVLTEIKDGGSLRLLSVFDEVPDTEELELLLNRALADELPRMLSSGGVIRDGFDEALDGARDAIAHAEENLKAFEQRERERTGIKVKIGINKVFGYFIEVSKSYANKVPDDYIRRQTVANGERFVNEELKDIERRALRAEHEIGEREEALYKDVLESALGWSGACQIASRSIATLDVLRALAETARDNGYTRPLMDGSRAFHLKGARHPIVEKSLGNLPFTPNDVDLNPDDEQKGCIAIITGPNMAGKSTYLRMSALVALMAHMGSFVPAQHAHVGLMDRIFTRIGARDELIKGRSTFMVEMVETANILRNVTSRSLVILDEIGRGTSTFDGMSIAWAVVEFLSLNIEGRTKALFATHYHELTNLDLPQIMNLSMAVEESSGGIRFLHKVVAKPADRSYGIEVARLAGVPNIVIKRAQELLSELERDSSKSGENLRVLSKKNIQMEIFFDVEREGVIEELSQCDTDNMTPMEALDLICRLRKKSRKILGLKVK
ncbi:MAG: DNA mismatch repair protein MutS [Synergistaceae bacterium]|jgi:DNA mismatch repair protein MutS|nr:DNA mismatch repair protein MutS [Synergistaceae bacterium]